MQERKDVSRASGLQGPWAVAEHAALPAEGQTRCEEQRLVRRMHELVREHPRYGYRFITAKLRQEGWQVNFKRIYRLWRREGFKVPRKTRKKRRLGHSGNSCVRRRAEHKDHVWTWDFIHDRTAKGRPLKWFAITDEYTRECLALEVDRSITADRVLDVLTSLFLTRGVPRHIRSDNGPEFIAKAIRRHAEPAGLEMLYIEPGAPWENGYAESFFSRLRDELLNVRGIHEPGRGALVRPTSLQEHNEERPHSSLDYQTPAEFAAGCAASVPAAPSTPAAHPNSRGNDLNRYPTHTLITPGTEIGGRSGRTPPPLHMQPLVSQ